MPTRVKILSFWLTFSVFGVEKGCNVTTFSSLLMSFGWLWAFWEFNFCCLRNKGGFWTFSHLVQNKLKGERHILVFIFSNYFHFNLYISFLLFLVIILKNAFRFGSFRYIRNGETEKTDVVNGKNK